MSVFTVLLAALCAAPGAALPLDSDARRCAGAIDKGSAGLAKAATSVALDCLKRAAKVISRCAPPGDSGHST